MSHLLVLVVGDDIERQLQPYHDFDCTGTNDEYVQCIDITAEILARIDAGERLPGVLSDYGLKDHILADEAHARIVGERAPDMRGYAVVQDGKLFKAVTRTNPNHKWDWWVIGGRWSEFLITKPGADAELDGNLSSSCQEQPAVNQARKGDIDMEVMRDKAGRQAAERWDTAASISRGEGWMSWKHVLDVVHGGNVIAAREAYRAQPVIHAVAQALYTSYDQVDEYLVPRDQYIEEERAFAMVPYAVVMNGEWLDKGLIEQLGVSEAAQIWQAWGTRAIQILEALPDDTLITVVDCHT